MDVRTSKDRHENRSSRGWSVHLNSRPPGAHDDRARPRLFSDLHRNGRWRHDGEVWTDWCAGFHAGMMWLLAERSGEPGWREQAEHYSRLLEHKQHDRDVHDLGFIFLNTYLPWYRATGDARLREVLITAGRTLALRYQPAGRYLRSFVAPESLFIDIMMNVPLIFYAARRPATTSCTSWPSRTAGPPQRTLVRADGSTAHEGIFDPETGEFLRQSTQQGLAPDSAWARGLAWSLYGFGTVFTYTGREPTWPWPGATPTASSPGARRAWSPPGISTCPPAPTGSTTARPPRSPPRASGTSPRSSNRANPPGPGATAMPR